MLNEDYTPAPCRSLFQNGEWQVPPGERPPDWQDRTAARNDAPTKAPYVCVREGIQPKVAKPRGFQAGHLKYGGRKKSAAHRRVTITAPEVAARLEAGETIYTLAKALSCHPSLLYRLVQKAGIALPLRKCQTCGGLTGKRAHAKFCATCATARWEDWSREELLERIAEVPMCIIPGCVSPGLHWRGMCSKCYQRQRKVVTNDSI